MPRFLIERDIPGAGALPDPLLRLISRKSQGACEPDVHWLHSYVTENRLYCICIAADETAVREHARRCGLPADRIYRIRSRMEAGELSVHGPDESPERTRGVATTTSRA